MRTRRGIMQTSTIQLFVNNELIGQSVLSTSIDASGNALTVEPLSYLSGKTFEVKVDPSVPWDQIVFVMGGKIVGRIVGIKSI
jgi:hypothetical protein